MGRRKAREVIVKLLYQMEIVKDNLDNLAEQYFAENNVAPEDQALIRDQVKGIGDNIALIDEKIKGHLKSWDLERLSKPDLAILRNGVYELFFRNDISTGIVINEAVMLCKKYGTDDSYAFVNGLLGNLAKSRE